MKHRICLMLAITLVAWSRPVKAQSGPTQDELNAAAENASDWLYATHDYSGRRYVPADQITPENAADLQVVCLYQLGDDSAFHTNPIVYRGVMYITSKLVTAAIDAATCRVKWRHEWKPRSDEGWPQSRGVAIKDGMAVRGSTDGYLYALDLETGEILWERKLADIGQHEGGFTMPPLIFEDLIIAGPAGSELGVKGWIGAFRLEDGEPVWRFDTVPEAGDPGSETWENPESRLLGGGAVWTPITIDVETGYIYVATANPAPDFYGDIRPGDNLYTSTMLALDVRTGQHVWHYQVVPHDVHDWDLTHAGPLFETVVDNTRRKLVATVGKDGVLHVLDRENREHLWQTPVTTQKNRDVPLTTEGVYVCPGILGGVEWNGPAYSPATNLLYVNAVDWCTTFASAEELRYVDGQMYMGGSFDLDPTEEARGWLTAVDASTGHVRWRYQSSRPMLAAITATSGGVLFTGELTGDFMALDAESGEVLYRFNAGGPLNGGIATYVVDGRQYVAAMSGDATSFWEQDPGTSTAVVFALP